MGKVEDKRRTLEARVGHARIRRAPTRRSIVRRSSTNRLNVTPEQVRAEIMGECHEGNVIPYVKVVDYTIATMADMEMETAEAEARIREEGVGPYINSRMAEAERLMGTSMLTRERRLSSKRWRGVQKLKILRDWCSPMDRKTPPPGSLIVTVQDPGDGYGGPGSPEYS